MNIIKTWFETQSVPNYTKCCARWVAFAFHSYGKRERERVRVRACVCVCTYCDTGSIAPGCIVSPHSSFNFCVPCPHIYHFPINIHFLRTPNENDELRFHFMYNKEKRTKVHADGEVYLHPENIHRSWGSRVTLLRICLTILVQCHAELGLRDH